MNEEQTESSVDFAACIRTVVDGGTLTASQAEGAFDLIMQGKSTPVQMAAFLTALQTRGPSAKEVAGGVRALRTAMKPVSCADPGGLVDTAGTGGGTVTTFNISTAAALVAAGAGVRLAKHGNRSYSSRSGSADVLEALGVRIDLTPERMGEILEEAGIVFMFAPLLHPAMYHVGPVRRELAMPTIMNVLGPLTNPAGARRQVVGVSDPALIPLLIHALRELGHTRGLVVHGEPGMDEMSPLGVTRVAELDGERVREYEIEPGDVGLERHDAAGLAGGEPEDNARIILDVLDGRDVGAARSAILLNAGAAIFVADQADSLDEGVRQAAEALDSGRARAALEALRTASNRG